MKERFTEIGRYNEQVKGFLQKNEITPIVRFTIKNFNDNAQRKKLTNNQYNSEVEKFNQQHGFYLLKKGKEHTSSQIYYGYINYPYIERDSFRGTMRNYRKFVSEYNLKCSEENKEINKYNSNIAKTENKEEIARIKDFQKENSRLFSRIYNKKVEKLNEETPIFKKKRIQPVKFQHELTFSVLLGFYADQLKRRNEVLLNSNLPTSCLKNELPRLKIDHRKLSNHKIDEITRLDYCKKTAHNHIKRLREAGILIDYRYINQYKPVQARFSSEIIQISDGKAPKSENTDNQKDIQGCGKKLHDNNVSSRTFLKEKEIKDFAKGKVEKGTPTANFKCPADGYKTTTETINKNFTTTAEIQNILPDFLKKQQPPTNTQHPTPNNQQLTTNFLNRFQDKNELAEQLASGKFNAYTGLRYDYLQRILMYGFVSNEDFKNIVIQDFIKSSAKIWKEHTVYVGEWKKTINSLSESLFKNITRKETIINKLKEYRWKLNFARKWFLKTKVPALYPYSYFDTTRTQSNELGFYGLHSVFKSHLKYLEKRKKEQENQVLISNNRKRRLSNEQKLIKAIKKYENGAYNFKQLYDYVVDNLGDRYAVQISTLINKNKNQC